jgi:5-methylcytosine-specific restriction protein A
MASDHLELKLGLETTRAALNKAFGGPEAVERAQQGGIVPVLASQKLFVFSDPHKSKEHGYNFDGWTEGDDEGPVFDYTGTGSSGHQVLSGLNGTLLNHDARGLELYLFVADGQVKSGGAKKQRLVGQMQVDAEQPYTERWDYDSTGALRRVFVFRLRPVDPEQTDMRPEDAVQPAKKTEAVPIPKKVPAPVKPGAKSKKTEKHSTGQTTATITGGERVVNRREGQLFTAFEAHLEQAGHTFSSYQITVEGEPSTLTPDLYDETDHALYEGKGLTTRPNVRMAIGQLADYRRHLKSPETLRVAVLLPSEPTPDVKALLKAEGVHLVFRTDTGFSGFPLPPSV